MDLFGRKARKQLLYMQAVLIRDKEAIDKARQTILKQESEILALKQEIQWLKMCEGLDINYPNSTKEN